MFFIALIQTSLTSQIPSLQQFRKLKGLAVQATGEKECRRQYLTFLFNMRMSSCIQLLRIIAEWDSKKSEILLNKRLIVNLFRGKSKEILDKMMKQGAGRPLQTILSNCNIVCSQTVPIFNNHWLLELKQTQINLVTNKTFNKKDKKGRISYQ